MTTYYSVNKTKNLAPSNSNILPAAENGSPVRFMHDSYEAAGVVKGSTIKMGGVIPKGAIIDPDSKLYHDALGSNSALAVGTAALGVELSASEATTSAGTLELGADVDSFGTPLTADSEIYVSVSGTGAITGTLRLALKYVSM